jgi:hypothetical protein
VDGDFDSDDDTSIAESGSDDTSADPTRTPNPDIFDLHVGEQLDGYRLERPLGKGGMGRVFEARHVASDEVVALKLLTCNDPALLTRFKREFRVLATVSHENLIRLRALRVLSDTRAYITMERIHGQPFVEWVRLRTPIRRLPNSLRLRRAMRQLIAGVERLHRERCIHRDLKPSNVLVTAEGRVVILDFGLIRQTQSGTPTLTRAGQAVGTPAYMAPEQAEGRPTGAPADWYAVGVMLFECLTGMRPFVGEDAVIKEAKQRDEVPDPGKLVYGLSEPLRELCMRLLARDPEQRAGARELIAGFGDGSGPMPAAAEEPVFVGRERELGCLRAALSEVRNEDKPVVVRLVGPSGIGKSTLVRRFFTELDGDPEVTALRCRCLERESLPYKGIDGIVDALALLIRRMPEADAAALQPRQLGALAKIFPVLANAWKDRGRTIEAEPKEQRRLGVNAFREVLGRLGDRRFLVIAIDDFQWADVDSARLLLDVLRPPDSPALLLIVGHAEGEAESEALELFDHHEAFTGIRVDEIQLGPLSRDEAGQLVHALASSESLSDEQLEQVLVRSQGSPLLMQQLVQADVDESLDDAADRVIVRRVLELSSEHRQLLEQVAVASGPLPRAAIESMVLPGHADSLITPLLELGLIRCDQLAGEIEVIETTHDRIRDLVVAELTPNELSRRHRELAKVLELHGGEPEAIAEHWEQGRRPQHAASWAEQAARQASGMLAFARAAAAYRRAVRVLGNLLIGPVDELRHELAEQLIALGQAKEAADLLLDLATRADPERASALRRRVAWLLLEAGRIEESVPLIAEQLEQVGEILPRQRWRTVLGLVWNRLLLRVRGLEFTPRAENEVDPGLLARIDTLNNFVAALSQYGHHPRAALMTAALRARLLRLALAAGEPSRVAYSLAHEGLILAASGGDLELGDRLVERGCSLLGSTTDAALRLRVLHLEAMLYFMTARWPRANEKIEALLRLTAQFGCGWLEPQLRARRAHLWLALGRFDELRRSLPGELAAMREQGNVYNIARVVVVDIDLCLCDGRIDEAEQRLCRFRADWTTNFHTFETTWLDMAAINVALFRGRIAEALQQTEATIAAAREHQVERILMIRLYLDNLLARVLGQALLGDPSDVALRRRLRAAIRRLRGSDKPMFVGTAASARALLHELEGEHEAAHRAWQGALAAFEACGMLARAAAVRVRIAEHADEGVAWFEHEHVGGWRRFVEVFAPSVQPALPLASASG